jgi:hypothetical protein
VAQCLLMTTHKLPFRFAPACIVLTLAVTACGSDATTMTKADYQSAANAVCAEAETKMQPIFAGIFPKIATATEAERKTATDGLLSVIDKEIDDLAALEPPASMKDDVDTMLESVRTAAGVVRQQGAGFWSDNSDPFGEVNKLASDLGLDACASDSTE